MFSRFLLSLVWMGVWIPLTLKAESLRAGVAKVDITDHAAGPVHDPSFAKVLVLEQGSTRVALITIDAVATEELGRIGNGFLATVRSHLDKNFAIPPSSVVVNASHCHGIIRGDTAQLVIEAVGQAVKQMVPVKVGAGVGHEDRISENRRLLMKDGSEVDMRRAYSLPQDADVAAVGPIDPQIGLLRLDKEDGTPLAIVYQFACHPIMNPPGMGSSADFPAYASKVIEDNLGHDALAFFLQGCGGDINPRRYKEINVPSSAEPLGTRLGLSAMAGARQIQTHQGAILKASNEIIALPRGADLAQRIKTIEAQRLQLLASLKPTNINFKTFVPLLIQQRLSPDLPSHYAQSYLRDAQLQQDSELKRLDADNRASVEAYLQNIHTMETLTRLNTNLALLQKHLRQNQEAGKGTVDVEIAALRIGNFKLITFPGELTVQIGLNIKKAAATPHTFVSGYTNGYIYYAPTVEQRQNKGYAQEDCDSILAPEWQQLFESKALEMLKRL